MTTQTDTKALVEAWDRVSAELDHVEGGMLAGLEDAASAMDDVITALHHPTPSAPDVEAGVTLLPCPCCASERIIPPPEHWPEGCVYCRSCGLRANSPAAWNTRQSTTPDAAAMREALEDAAKEFDAIYHDGFDHGVAASDRVGRAQRGASAAAKSIRAALNPGATA